MRSTVGASASRIYDQFTDGRFRRICRDVSRFYKEFAKVTTRFINRIELRQRYPVTDMTIWRWSRDPEVAFPKAIKFGKGTAARCLWALEELDEYDRRRAALRDVRG
jgi:predicted DNA-binding transcriptional regulator AlpA